MLKYVRLFFDWLFRPKFPSDQKIVEAYIAAGSIYGDSCTYIGGYADIAGKSSRSVWGVLEKEYAALGYRTVPIKALIHFGGFNVDLSDVVCVKRGPDEEPLLWEPDTTKPTPMNTGVLDRLAAIGDSPKCPLCERVLVEGERVHCAREVAPLVREALESDFAQGVVERLGSAVFVTHPS